MKRLLRGEESVSVLRSSARLLLQMPNRGPLNPVTRPTQRSAELTRRIKEDKPERPDPQAWSEKVAKSRAG